MAKDPPGRFARPGSLDRLEKRPRGILDTWTKTLAARAPNLCAVIRPIAGGPAQILVSKFYGLRVSADEEEAGLDISEHGMYGYPEHFVPAPAPTTQEVPAS